MIKINVILTNNRWKEYLKSPINFIDKKMLLINKKNKFHKKNIYKNKQKDNFALKIIRLQEKLKPNIKINIDFFKIDRAIQGFFQKIENKIQEFKKLRLEEKQRIKIENFERQEREKREAQENKEAEENLI